MTDIRFFEMAEEKAKFMGDTLLEYNSTHRLMLCYSPVVDGLFIHQYDDLSMDKSNHKWHCLRGVPNSNEGFQYIMDLYQLMITKYIGYKKR